MRMIKRACLVALYTVTAVTATAREEDGRDWLNLPIWDEGLAEVCLYEGKMKKYGALRPFELDVITVREHFDPEKLVKTRPAKGKETIPIMKVNIRRAVRTGVYKYVQMASVFVDRRDAGLVKLSTE